MSEPKTKTSPNGNQEPISPYTTDYEIWEEEKGVEIHRKEGLATISRINNYKELEAATEEEGYKIYLEKAKEVWKDLAVHGIMGQVIKWEKDDTGQKVRTEKVMLTNHTDLDGQAAIGLLKLSGVDTSGVEYVKQGEYVQGKINLDTGDRFGFVIEDEGRTVFIDHHTPEGGIETSATKITYEILTAPDPDHPERKPRLERTEYLDKLVEFVNQMDNKTFPDEEKHYKGSMLTMVGLWKFARFDNLLNFFKDGHSPTELLSSSDLEKYHLLRAATEKKDKVEESLKTLRELDKTGFIINTDKYGKIAVDIGRKIKDGFDAARFYGCQGYIIWNPESNGFFITTTQPIEEDFGQGVKVRGRMWVKPRDDEPLRISLSEVLNKLTDNKLSPTGKLAEYLLQEKGFYDKMDRIKATTMAPESETKIVPNPGETQTTEQPNKGLQSFIEDLEDARVDGKISSEDFNTKKALVLEASKSPDPLEFLEDARVDGKLSSEEFNKLRGLLSTEAPQNKTAQPEPQIELAPKPQISSENLESKTFQSFIEDLEESLVDDKISREEFNAKKQLVTNLLAEMAKSDGNPLEFLEDARVDGKLSSEEFNKLRGLLAGKSPEVEVAPATKAEADTQTEDDLKRKTLRLEEVDKRLQEINQELRGGMVVQGWDNVLKLKKEEKDLNEEKKNLLAEGVKIVKGNGETKEEFDLVLNPDAESPAKQLDEIEKKIKQKREELNRGGNAQTVLERRPEEERLRKEIKVLEKEKKELTKGLGKTFQTEANKSFNKANEEIEQTESKKSKLGAVWGWIKERFKSLKQGPIRGELKQAEALRQGTAHVANLTETYADILSENLKKEDAEEVAKEVKESLDASSTTLSPEDFKQLTDQTIKERIEQNNREVERMVSYVTTGLMTALSEARGQATAEKVLTPKRIKEIQDELRRKLNEVRNETAKLDAKELKNFLRKHLDRWWWLRYGYALGELGGVIGLKILFSKALGMVFGGREVTTISPPRSPELFSGRAVMPINGPEEIYMNPGENPWDPISKKIAQEVGLNNPTNDQILAIDKAFVKENGIAVPEWGVEGTRLHTELPPGYYFMDQAKEVAKAFVTK